MMKQKQIAYKKRYTSPEERQQIIDELKLVPKNYLWVNVNPIVALEHIKMEYQKIRNLLGNASNQPSIFRTRNWVEINDDSRGTYSSKSIRFNITMLRSNLCDYADAYILVKGTITITGVGDNVAARRADEREKGVIFKNCVPFIERISRINNTEIDNAKVFIF